MARQASNASVAMPQDTLGVGPVRLSATVPDPTMHGAGTCQEETSKGQADFEKGWRHREQNRIAQSGWTSRSRFHSCAAFKPWKCDRLRIRGEDPPPRQTLTPHPHGLIRDCRRRRLSAAEQVPEVASALLLLPKSGCCAPNDCTPGSALNQEFLLMVAKEVIEHPEPGRPHCVKRVIRAVSRRRLPAGPAGCIDV